ncbi:uracil-DNA glycosylase [Legionella bononiensis]|uniref:Uracil-DNA glycosylase n=1 Tax=Legionella bononiensis TaxID=2793102 RepID=A0ABS1WCI9_9GAMM|nr:uracil-DNA glycosylase [Legionella bononiensis]MBL7478932.1 uracil-DNA glycosylase [Legionella bononiensis]MBL7527064.1 uracil-DNA glycosylase [Legionella bononiensis]MBL7562033.1 uracil-DNA glycosylase [Legionella bononiensis]
MNHHFLLDKCHPEWQQILNTAIDVMDKNYFNQLLNDKNWLPGITNLFSAFSLSLSNTRYILFGESPYPRVESANGYAFWDNSVQELWSSQGLAKSVNRATSLRNMIKMLLIARGDLQEDTSQQAIAEVDKQNLVHTAEELFRGMMNKGILLLNACLVYSEGKVPYHARYWHPFMNSVLEQLLLLKSSVQLILLGKIANNIPQDILSVGLMAEHPYNVSFITNQHVIEFFKPLDLLAYE